MKALAASLALLAFSINVSAVRAQDSHVSRISGHVYDADTHKPLSAVSVKVVGDMGSAPVTTDSDGVFILELTSAAKAGEIVRIRCEKRDYDPLDKQVPVSSAYPQEFLMRRAKLKNRNAQVSLTTPGIGNNPSGPPREEPPDGTNITIASGPSLSHTHPDETQFIVTNHNTSPMVNAFSACEFYDENGANGPITNVVTNNMRDLSSGDSTTITCEIPIADFLIKPMAIPADDIWIYYEYRGKQMKKGFHFIGKRNEEGAYVWLPYGSVNNLVIPKQ